MMPLNGYGVVPSHHTLMLLQLWMYIIRPPCSYASPALSDPRMLSSSLNLNDAILDVVAENRHQREMVNRQIVEYSMRRLRQEGRDMKTGQAYEVKLPRWTGAVQGAVRECEVMREKAKSLGSRGMVFHEFRLPTNNAIRILTLAQGEEQQQLLLIYHSINDITSNFTLYKLPPGYTIISPVVGIYGYTYSPTLNTSAVTELQLFSRDPASPITIALPRSLPTRYNTTPLCAFFYPNGSFSFSNLAFKPNVCSSLMLCDTALVLPPRDHPPTPHNNSPTCNILSTISPHSPTTTSPTFILIITLGGIAALATLVATITLAHRLNSHCINLFSKWTNKQAGIPSEDGQETLLYMSTISHTLAPTAPALRTRPTLEVSSLQHPK